MIFYLSFYFHFDLDFSFKFYVENTKAQVQIDIEHRNEIKRIQYFEKLESLKNILEEEFISDLVFEKNFSLENGKTISRIWVEQLEISINNKNTWTTIFDFFNANMDAFERFFYEIEDYIKDLEINT